MSTQPPRTPETGPSFRDVFTYVADIQSEYGIEVAFQVNEVLFQWGKALPKISVYAKVVNIAQTPYDKLIACASFGGPTGYKTMAAAMYWAAVALDELCAAVREQKPKRLL